jgi:hypothetical protein
MLNFFFLKQVDKLYIRLKSYKDAVRKAPHTFLLAYRKLPANKFSGVRSIRPEIVVEILRAHFVPSSVCDNIQNVDSENGIIS